MTRTFELETARDGWHVIDAQVRQAVAESGVKDGICPAASAHTTAAVAATSSWDPKGIEDSIRDIKAKFPGPHLLRTPLFPFHLRRPFPGRALAGCGRTFIVRDGALLLGHSQTLLI